MESNTVNRIWESAIQVGQAFDLWKQQFQTSMTQFQATLRDERSQIRSMSDFDIGETMATVRFAGCDFRFVLSLHRHGQTKLVGVISLYRRLDEHERGERKERYVLCNSMEIDRHMETSLKDEYGDSVNLSDNAAIVAIWLQWLTQGAATRESRD